MTLGEFQNLIRQMYHEKDAVRGVERTFMWLTEEIGEFGNSITKRFRNEKQGLQVPQNWLCVAW
jgi:hypothetical protein